MGIPEPASSSHSMSYDTIFQAAVLKSAPPAEDGERTVFDPTAAKRGGPQRAAPPARDSARGPAVSELLIEEPEPASDAPGRNTPRPKNRRGGGGGGGSASGILKWLVVAGLAGAAGFSIYYFVWPLLGESTETATNTGSPAPATTSVPAAAPPSGGASAATTAPPAASTPSGLTPVSPATTTAAPSDPRAGASVTGTPPSSAAPRAGAASPPAATATSKPPDPVSASSPSGAPKPPPASSAPSTAGGNGRDLLQSGNLAAAARAFHREISSQSGDKFTLALGLYCNEENAGRLVAGASGSSDIYILPTSVEGRSCYRVIWGLYDSREAAERSIPSLPNGVRAGDVAPVAVSRFLR